MYESYSRQCLPSRRYRELLGSAICVFNSNNSFIIENILKNDSQGVYSWHTLINYTSGQLSSPVKETITKNSSTEIAKKIEEVVVVRNRIIHSFQITAPVGSDLSDDEDRQMLSTRHKNGKQEYITEDFILKFIKINEELSLMLHAFRGY